MPDKRVYTFTQHKVGDTLIVADNVEAALVEWRAHYSLHELEEPGRIQVSWQAVLIATEVTDAP